MNYADYEIGRMQTFISEFKNKKLRELEEKKKIDLIDKILKLNFGKNPSMKTKCFR